MLSAKTPAPASLWPNASTLALRRRLSGYFLLEAVKREARRNFDGYFLPDSPISWGQSLMLGLELMHAGLVSLCHVL